MIIFAHSYPLAQIANVMLSHIFWEYGHSPKWYSSHNMEAKNMSSEPYSDIISIDQGLDIRWPPTFRTWTECK